MAKLAKNEVVVAVQEVVGGSDLLARFDAMMAEQLPDIDKAAEMMVSVEKWETDAETAQAGIASLLFGVLDSQGELTLAFYDVVRLAWGDKYRALKGLPADAQGAVDTAWSRSFGLVTKFYGVTKPKAETKGAEKKAEQRAKQEEKLAAYIDKPVDELRSQARELFNQSSETRDKKEASKLRAEANLISKAIDKIQSAEVADTKEAVKAIKKLITAMLKHVDDLGVLGDVQVLLDDALDDDTREELLLNI